MENLQPPTDNLYKFLAIGGLAFLLLAVIFLYREQAARREQYVDAQIQLLSGGYQEGIGMPSDPALRSPYFRREAAIQETTSLLKLFGTGYGAPIGIPMIVSIVGFGLWGWRVQRHEDAILRLTAKKLQREERKTSARLQVGNAS